MKKQIYILFFCLYSLNVLSQNLVPNSGFTNFTGCPSHQNELFYAYPWISPSLGTPDFYHSCNNGVPNSLPLFYQQDHSNTNGGYAAIGVFNSYQNTFQGREYVQVKLIDSLHQGSHYCIEFYESLSDASGLAISDLGVYLSNLAVSQNNDSAFAVSPQIINANLNFLTDTVSWTKIGGIYTSFGGEQYITIGNFSDSSSSHAIVVNPLGYLYAYYLIDDVSIINCDSLFIDVNEINLSVATSLFPNPVKDVITIDFSGYALDDVEVRIINLLEKEEGIYHNKWCNKMKLNLENLLPGLYIAEIRSKNGVVCKKFLKE